MNVQFSTVVFIIGVLSAHHTYAASMSPQDVIKMTVSQVKSRIEDERSTLDANPERIFDLANELIIPHFDFVSTSKWVLGKNWKAANQDQRQKFVNEFKNLLVHTYANALLEYSNRQIEYLPPEEGPKPNLAVVKTNFILENTNPLPINYRMYNKDGGWKIIDVTVDGVSMTSTYRNSFASEIDKNGIDALIAKLRERTTELSASSSR